MDMTQTARERSRNIIRSPEVRDPDESCGIERALHGHHYLVMSNLSRCGARRPPRGARRDHHAD